MSNIDMQLMKVLYVQLWFLFIYNRIQSCEVCKRCPADIFNMCLLAELTHIFVRFCHELAIRPEYVRKVRYSEEYQRTKPPDILRTDLGG